MFLPSLRLNKESRTSLELGKGLSFPPSLFVFRRRTSFFQWPCPLSPRTRDARRSRCILFPFPLQYLGTRKGGGPGRSFPSSSTAAFKGKKLTGQGCVLPFFSFFPLPSTGDGLAGKDGHRFSSSPLFPSDDAERSWKMVNTDRKRCFSPFPPRDLLPERVTKVRRFDARESLFSLPPFLSPLLGKAAIITNVSFSLLVGHDKGGSIRRREGPFSFPPPLRTKTRSCIK